MDWDSPVGCMSWEDSIRYVSLASWKGKPKPCYYIIWRQSGCYLGRNLRRFSNRSYIEYRVRVSWNSKMSHRSCFCMGVSEDSEGNIWIGRGDASLLIYDPQTGTFRLVKVLLECQKFLKIWFVWICGIWTGLFLIKISNGLLKGSSKGQQINCRLFYPVLKGKPASTNFIYKVLVDSQGSIWTATWKYYCRKFVLKDGFLVEVSTRTKDFDKMSIFRSVFEDTQKNIWMPIQMGCSNLVKLGTVFRYFHRLFGKLFGKRKYL